MVNAKREVKLQIRIILTAQSIKLFGYFKSFGT